MADITERTRDFGCDCLPVFHLSKPYLIVDAKKVPSFSALRGMENDVIKQAYIVCAAILVASTAHAENEDPTALENYRVIAEGETNPTVASVADLKARAYAAYDAENCDEALPLLVELAQKSNVLGNMIRRGLEPFYSADRDKVDKFFLANKELQDDLGKSEGAANSYTRERNEAWVKEAECLVKTGDIPAATIRAYRALDYIDIGSIDQWTRARNIIWDAVEYKP